MPEVSPPIGVTLAGFKVVAGLLNRPTVPDGFIPENTLENPEVEDAAFGARSELTNVVEKPPSMPGEVFNLFNPPDDGIPLEFTKFQVLNAPNVLEFFLAPVTVALLKLLNGAADIGVFPKLLLTIKLDCQKV